MPDPVDLQSALDELTATTTDENAAADALVDAYAAVPQRIADAVAAALKTGATQAQLAAFGTLKAQMQAEADKMKAALAAPVPPTA